MIKVFKDNEYFNCKVYDFNYLTDLWLSKADTIDIAMYVRMVQAKPTTPKKDRKAIALNKRIRGFSLPLIFMFSSLNENIGNSETINNERAKTNPNVKNKTELLVEVVV